AGGLQQLWTWTNGELVKVYSNKSSAADVDDVSGFHFRVRQIRFVPGTLPTNSVEAVAVTAGCCAADEADNRARVLIYEQGKWYVRLLSEDHDVGAPVDQTTVRRDVAPLRSLPDSYYSLAITQDDPGTGRLSNPELSVVI